MDNEIVAYKSLEESEAVIKNSENFIGMGLQNIGAELKYIRDNKTYEEKGYFSFEEYAGMELDYSRRHAYNFIEIAEKYSVQSIAQIGHLGITKLIELGKIEEEERKEFIENNPVEDMTTRELQKAIKEKKKLEKEVEELKSREPEIVEIEVDHYHQKYITEQYNNSVLAGKIQDLERSLKNKEINKAEYDELRKELIEKSEENYDLKKQLEQSIKLDSETKHQEKLKDSALIFSTRIHTFLNDVGGLAWLTEYIEELDEYSKNSYYKALDLLEGWVLTVKSNIDKEKN